MRALVVGLGSIGARHLANLRTLHPEVSVSAWRHRVAGEQDTPLPDGVARVVFDADAAVAEKPDCVLVTGPAHRHVAAALPFALRGVPLFVEKPLCASLEEADVLLDACARSGAPLLVGYCLRYSPALMSAAKALAEGRIGRVLGIRAEAGQYLPDWRPGTDYRRGVSARSELGGGALMELSHEFDYVRWLAGDVSSVCARTGRTSDLDIDVEDLAEVVLQFRSGAIGSVHLDMVQRVPTRTCRVIGAEGTIVWDGIRQHAALYSASARCWTDLWPADAGDRNRMYLDELRHFLECASGRALPQVTGHDGRRALEMVLAARRSSVEARTVTM